MGTENLAARPVAVPKMSTDVVAVEPTATVTAPAAAVEEDTWPLPTNTDTEQAPEGPVALEESLSEVAAFDSERDPEFESSFDAELDSEFDTDFDTAAPTAVSEDLLRDMRTAKRGGSWLSMAGLFLLMITLTAGVASGWWLTHTGYLPGLAAVTPPEETSVTARRPAREDVSLTSSSRPVAAGKREDESTTIVTGRIEYVSEAGHLLPDAGALVMLLPRARQGTSLLDGGNLRLSTEAPDFQATVAAMNVLGATATQADERGDYQMPYRSGSKDQIVVVSQHRAASDDNVPTDIQNLLLNWFESPIHVTGRLAVAAGRPPESGPLDFRIGVAP